MRIFISVELPPEVKERIAEIAEELPEDKGLFSKVNSDNVHLTLKFLGDVNRVERVKERLDKIEFEPFELTTSDLGFFPDDDDIKVFWLGFEESEGLEKLAEDVRKVLPGFKDDKAFHAHATIARVKEVYDKEVFRRFVYGLTPEPVTFTVNSFQLMQSELTPEGPVYNVVKEYTPEE